MNVEQIFNDFEGEWKLSRIINLKSKLNQYKAFGSARFIRSSDEDNLLLYSEELILNDKVNKAEIKAVQSYKYVFDNSQNVIKKLFKDGSHFYDLILNGEKACAKHLCVNDSYIAEYVFNKNKFSLTYSVLGPEKDYIIYTRFEKVL